MSVVLHDAKTDDNIYTSDSLRTYCTFPECPRLQKQVMLSVLLGVTALFEEINAVKLPLDRSFA